MGQFVAVHIGDLSSRPFRHPVAVWIEGDAPIQKQAQSRPHGMGAGFHHHKFALWDGLQFVWRHERALHHLQGLAALLALADGAGEHRAAAKGGGEGLRGFALGRKAAEDGVLAVIANDLRALFSIVLFQLGKALDDGHQRQPAGAASAEQRQDVEGRHGAQLIAEQHHTVLESAVMLVRHGEQLAGKVLDHKARDEVLGGVFLRQNQEDGALL